MLSNVNNTSASKEGPGPLVFGDILWSVGPRILYIRATDSRGDTGESEMVAFRVLPRIGDGNAVSLHTPVNGMEYNFSEGVSIVPIVSVHDTWDPLGIRVEYWEGETKIGGASDGPYGFRWYPEVGEHRLKAKVIIPDPEGQIEFESDDVNFRVR